MVLVEITKGPHKTTQLTEVNADLEKIRVMKQNEYQGVKVFHLRDRKMMIFISHKLEIPLFPPCPYPCSL